MSEEYMGGYAFQGHPAEGKIADIWARALALYGTKGQKTLIVIPNTNKDRLGFR